MPTYTTHYGFYKPAEGDGDENSHRWAEGWNANLDAIDAQLKGHADSLASQAASIAANVTAIADKMANPMTTAGDLVIGGPAGTPQRVAKGVDNAVFQMKNGVPGWNPSGGLPPEILNLFSMEVLPSTPSAWDDSFDGTSLGAAWTSFNLGAVGSVSVSGGKLTIATGGASGDATNTYRGVWKLPPSTSSNYSILASIRLEASDKPLANYADAGVGVAWRGGPNQLIIGSILKDANVIDMWYGPWNNGAPTWSGATTKAYDIPGLRKLIRVDVSAAEISFWTWELGYWKWNQSRATPTGVFPDAIVLGVKRQNETAGTCYCYAEWIRVLVP